MEHLPAWVLALILPSAMTIATGMLLKFLPMEKWGKLFSAFLRLRFGKDNETKIEDMIIQLETEFNKGMKEDN